MRCGDIWSDDMMVLSSLALDLPLHLSFRNLGRVAANQSLGTLKLCIKESLIRHFNY